MKMIWNSNNMERTGKELRLAAKVLRKVEKLYKIKTAYGLCKTVDAFIRLKRKVSPEVFNEVAPIAEKHMELVFFQRLDLDFKEFAKRDENTMSVPSDDVTTIFLKHPNDCLKVHYGHKAGYLPELDRAMELYRRPDNFYMRLQSPEFLLSNLPDEPPIIIE